MVDLLFTGGTVIDGSGRPSFTADVAIRGDRIERVGDLREQPARQTIDVRGLVIAPGFIDVHNHSDGWLLKYKNFLPKTRQGFTTEVIASDGISYAPWSRETAADWIVYLRALNGLTLADDRGWESLAEYLGHLDGATSQNVVAQIPYANLRVLACGWGRAPADDVQLKLMRQEVRRGIEAGAVGISTGLDYISQCFATTDEIVAVCRELAEVDGLYVTHVRYKSGLLAAVAEAVEIGRRAGVKVHVSHLKGLTADECDGLLDYIDRVAMNEVDFSFDVYPYLSGSTLISSLLPYEAWEDGPLGVAARLRSGRLRRRFADLLDDYRLPLDEIHLAWVATREHQTSQGRSLASLVDESGKTAANFLADLLIEEQLAALAVFGTGDDSLADPFLAHPLQMVGSDGIYFADGIVHPRVYGTAPRMLGPLVRDRQLFSLEAAVRKLSGWPAERFGLVDRGVIRDGAFADLVVFDPSTVGDRATFTDPHQPPDGILHVVTNGIPIIQNSEPTAASEEQPPGRVLHYRR